MVGFMKMYSRLNNKKKAELRECDLVIYFNVYKKHRTYLFDEILINRFSYVLFSSLLKIKLIRTC